MDTKDTRTRRLVRWLKDKIEKRQDGRDDHDPWWVTLMLDVGRPVVAIMILTMCAPGEHYLMEQARFHDPFAWLGPATLTAYAGIAAVTATKRPKGSPGHSTAVVGAVMAIGLAMAAQPIAHLWGIRGLDLQKIILICVVSSVPSAVFGHLLHMGASAPKPGRRTAARPDKAKRADKRTDTAPDKAGTKPQWLTDNEVSASAVGLSVSELLSAPDSPPDAMTWTGDTDNRPDMTPDNRTPRRMASGSMKSFVLSAITDRPDVTDDELKTAIRDTFGQDSKDNSMYVAIKRARKEWRISA